VLVAPQIAITIVFFYWPALDSVRLSLFRASPFGDIMIFVGWGNFAGSSTTPAICAARSPA
jgi:sn-glycerol 3-phosphate transport system permease protein